MTAVDGVERATGVAVWRQIAEQLRRDLASGAFAADGKLPPETALARRFGVNRHTLRRAVAALADEGLLRSVRGKGIFVSKQPLRYPIGPRTRFSEIVSAQNREPGGRLIASALEQADGKLAGHLRLALGAGLIRLDSMHVADAIPLSVTSSWFPAERFPRLVAVYAETGSITKALLAHGLSDYRRRDTRILAETATPADAALLGLVPGDPVLVCESVNVDPDDRPVQYARARFAASRVELSVAS